MTACNPSWWTSWKSQRSSISYCGQTSTCLGAAGLEQLVFIMGRRNLRLQLSTALLRHFCCGGELLPLERQLGYVVARGLQSVAFNVL